MTPLAYYNILYAMSSLKWTILIMFSIGSLNKNLKQLGPRRPRRKTPPEDLGHLATTRAKPSHGGRQAIRQYSCAQDAHWHQTQSHLAASERLGGLVKNRLLVENGISSNLSMWFLRCRLRCVACYISGLSSITVCGFQVTLWVTSRLKWMEV